MTILLASQATGILSPVSKLLGIIFNGIYKLLMWVSSSDSANIILCIAIFTFFVKLLLTPLMIKQQKSMRVQTFIMPEIKALAEKYKGKTDEESRRRQMIEQQDIYKKYGASQFAGCLPILITLFVMLALYNVVSNVPAYVDAIYNWFKPVAEAMHGITDGIQITDIIYMNPSEKSINELIDMLNRFSPDEWKQLEQHLPAFADLIASSSEKIITNNTFFGMNLAMRPSFTNVTIIIPILSILSQYLSNFVSKIGLPKRAKSTDPTTQSSEMMLKLMPIMSGVFCCFVSISLGMYWIIGALFSALQTLLINLYINHIGVDKIIEKNLARQAKRVEKMGIAAKNDANSIVAKMARYQTKTIEYGNNDTTKENEQDNDTSQNDDGGTKSISYYAKYKSNR